jgi:hypothetical protein
LLSGWSFARKEKEGRENRVAGVSAPGYNFVSIRVHWW